MIINNCNALLTFTNKINVSSQFNAFSTAICPQVENNFRDNGSEASTRAAEDCVCGQPGTTLDPNGNGKPSINHCS